MYAGDTGGCGCGGGTASARSGVDTRQRLGHIDSQGRCVCGECESCDGLTCTCRPRFYDGQLLSAADFNRLDHYIVTKNQLHNRYLHGVGVVCGLEAVCSPCEENTVTVRPGYALGPCGEDIVVCQDANVDVAAMIRAQRSAAARSDCPPYSEPARDYEKARQTWVLAVCYDERPSRPMTALKRSGGCSCRGSCGGSCRGATSSSSSSSGNGCGSGGSCSPAATTPATCEATEVCEGYRFTLTKVQPSELRRGDDLTKAQSYATGEAQGQLPAVVRACLARLSGGLTKIPSNPTPSQVVAYAAQLKSDLRDVVETGNVHDCTLLQRLNAVAIPAGTSESSPAHARTAITEMLQIVIDLFRECICSALLPPCGVGCADDCVPLATVTVRSSDLRVLDICNWSARQFVITMPTLSYWLGWLPIFGSLRNALERLCCTRADRPSFDMNDRLKVREAAAMPKPASAKTASTSSADTAATAESATDPTAAFAALAGQYASAWSSLSGLEATVLGAVGARSTRNKPMATETELDHPLAALALGRIGVDVGAELLPPDLASRLVAGAAPQSGQEDRLASLEESLTKLRRKVDNQARTIRDLRAKGPDQ